MTADAGMDYIRCAQIFKALAHPARLRIVALIRQNQPCVKAIEEILGMSQSNVSQHLAILRHLGVIHPEREGNQVCYRLVDPKICKLLDVLTENQSQGVEHG